MHRLGIYTFGTVPVLEKDQCIIILDEQWVVYQTTGGLAFKKYWKKTYGTWPKGRYPFYAETLDDRG